MPQKNLDQSTLPVDVAQSLSEWGQAIRTARIRQRITVRDFARRIQVSPQTLSRTEAGDPVVQAGTFLAALWALGLLGTAAPPLPAAYWQVEGIGSRVRKTREERDDDF
jgi:transcriptional regulator with XRE-family HTH domain